MIKLFMVTLVSLAVLLVFDAIRNIYDRWYIRQLKHEWELNNKNRKH